MKVKALFVAPYAAMENLIDECREEEHELDLQIEIGNLHEGVKFAKEAEARGVDLIISRGGTAKLIGEAVDIPVIDVHLSGYDMLRVLTIANDFPRKKAIVGFSAITLGAKAIIDLLEIPIDIFTIESEGETEPLLNTLKQEGYQLIMGDVVTFETASKLGLIGILIQSGREAIIGAFKEAKMVSKWMEKSKLEIGRLRNILKITATDLMVLSENGDVIYEQWKHFNGCPIADFSGEISPAQDNEGNRKITQVIALNRDSVKVMKTKLLIDDSSVFVYEFEPIMVDPLFQEKLNVSVLSAPLIIHQSEAMKMCLTLINRCLSYNHFILIGKRGTGKELIAEYIHYHKYNGSGLYATIKAIDVQGLNPEMMDGDIKTIYIHSIEQLDEGQKDEFWQKLVTLRKMGLTTILPMTRELPLWGNKIYEDEVIRIPIPALTERKEDLKELVTAFILHLNQTLGTSVIKVNEKGLALLEEYSWPGNVDELRALIKDAVLMEKDYVINHQLIEGLLNRKRSESKSEPLGLLSGSLENIEKRIIEKVLEEEDYNQTKAAKRLNINRSTLWRKLKN